MAKQAQTTIQGNFEVKAAPYSKALDYNSFGWTRAKGEVPAGTKIKSKEQIIPIRRRLAYGRDGLLRAYESEYLKREKKRYRQLPILGIICFFLMIAFLAVV